MSSFLFFFNFFLKHSENVGIIIEENLCPRNGKHGFMIRQDSTGPDGHSNNFVTNRTGHARMCIDDVRFYFMIF